MSDWCGEDNTLTTPQSDLDIAREVGKKRDLSSRLKAVEER